MKIFFKILFVITICLSSLSCGITHNVSEAKRIEFEALRENIAQDNFNVIITQTVPKQGSYESFSEGRYLIRVRKGKAEVFLPNVSDNGTAVFGGNNSSVAEVVQMTATKTSEDTKGNHRYVLNSIKGAFDYEIKLDINENGQGKVTVTRKPYYVTRYYATVESPINQ